MAKSLKLEGFWYSEFESKFPIPKKDEINQEEANAISKYLINYQRSEKVWKTVYKGRTYYRFTLQKLGNKEYQDKVYCWPGDYTSHYIRQHRVKPSDAFLKDIGYIQKKPVNKKEKKR